VIMLMSAVAAAGLFIAALAGGFEGWVAIAAVAVVILFLGGFFSLRAGTRRAVEHEPIIYHPDSTDVSVEIDPDTGERLPHRE
ncbi:MAG: hypothetical protein WBA81_19295, partial [Rhodococcus sp. (in: high G+C Gram-positive bacteria)]